MRPRQELADDLDVALAGFALLERVIFALPGLALLERMYLRYRASPCLSANDPSESAARRPISHPLVARREAPAVSGNGCGATRLRFSARHPFMPRAHPAARSTPAMPA